MGCGESNHFGPPLWFPGTVPFFKPLTVSFKSFYDMIFKLSTILVLLSALSSYYVSGAVVSLLVLDAEPHQALAGKYLGTDAQGHTSWSVGPGTPSGSFTDTDFPNVTLVAGASDAHQVEAFKTVFTDVTLSATASEGCAFATPASGGVVSATCSGVGQVVGATSSTTTTSVVSTAYATLAALVPVQVPDSGSGALPSKNSAWKGGINWGVAGPAVALILIAGLM
ncbi:hypothetical protein V8D89_007571 [Ganoderma adspersum]